MLHFTRPNPKRQGPKRPMSGRMTISAHARSTGQSEALLRSNNVHNTLSFIFHTKVFEAKVGYVGGHLEDLCSGCLLEMVCLYCVFVWI